ncbi:hypothetical protein B7R22_12175 [Subtercola boreus]|uniref:Thioester domain-containing protein n=1 Tax=Subtercola boreus TaxID=120213 RepID=A0A3E0VVB8_9MICO|nr:hypothetical protein [Subtercola boreus]RFA13429.1 hypothetical protein B7R22_12175 [Subtercola boreus]
MNRLKRLIALSLTALVAAALTLTGVLILAPPANALPVVGHGFGHTWRVDGRSWLGSHRLSDGNLGLCLQVQNAPPEGTDVQYQLGNSQGWVSADDAARLAYIARRWSTEPYGDVAAAAQLATWAITGLGAHDMGWYAQRANEDAGVVLARATHMRETMDAPFGASRGVTAKLTLALSDATAGSVRSDVVVDYLNGGPTRLPSGTRTGTLTLTGASFADGSTVKQVRNGQTLPLTPSEGTALSDVTADVVYTDLGYGDAFYVAKAPAGVQSLLVPPPGGLTAGAHAHGGEISPLPFAPAVQTQTSSTEALVGAHLFDSLELGLAKVPKLTADDTSTADDMPVSAGTLPADETPPADEPLLPTTLSEWGVYRDEEGALQPVPVTVRSTLWGPFREQPTLQAAVPPGAAAVCTVAVLADNGPGSYRTPDCILPAEGFYVWTETIDPADTPVSKGGGRIRPWSSPFGAATEVTLAVTPPPPPVVTETPPPVPPLPPVAPTPSGTAPPTATPGPPSPKATPPMPGSGRDADATLASTGRQADAVTPWLAGGLAFVVLGAAAVGMLALQSARRRRL